jgi:hypothetical protein
MLKLPSGKTEKIVESATAAARDIGTMTMVSLGVGVLALVVAVAALMTARKVLAA